MAEGPGAQEDRAAVPLIGQSGKLLRAVLSEIYSKLGLDPQLVYLTNVVKCRPRVVDKDTGRVTQENRPPTDLEIANCLPWLVQEIEQVNPVCILALGATARVTIPEALQELGFYPAVDEEYTRGDDSITYVRRTESTQEISGPLILRETQGSPSQISKGLLSANQDSRSKSSKELFTAVQSDKGGMVTEFEKQPALYGLQGELPLLCDAVGPCIREARGSELREAVVLSSDGASRLEEDITGNTKVPVGVRKLSCRENAQPTEQLWKEQRICVISTWHPAYLLRQRHKLDDWKADIEQAVRRAFQIPAISTSRGTTPNMELGPVVLGSPYMAADTEFDDLEEHVVGGKLVGWSISDGQHADFFTCEPRVKGQHLFLHNAPADLLNLDLDPDDLDSYDDTMSIAYPLAQRYGWQFLGLKRKDGQGLAQLLCGVNWPFVLSDMLKVYDRSERVLKSGKNKGQLKVTIKERKVPFSEVLASRPADCRLYAATDAFGTAQLAKFETDLWADNPWARDWYYHFDKPLIPVLLNMQLTGVKIDTNQLNQAGAVIDSVRVDTEQRLRQTFGPEINLGSNQQMGSVLYDMGLVDGKLTPTGWIQVDEKNILASFGVEKADDLPDTDLGRLAGDYLEWRKMGKLRSTYVNAINNRLDSESRIHGRFNASSTDTSRLSSADPNLQNIPAPGKHVSAAGDTGLEIRRAFIARQGYVLVVGDFTQLQLVIYAKYNPNDQIFKETYGTYRPDHLSDCKCELCDLHGKFTNRINSWDIPGIGHFNVQRKFVKNGVFGTLFGAEAQKMSETLMIPIEYSALFIAKMNEDIPSLAHWPDVAAQQLASCGYVDTLMGWRLYKPDFVSPVNKWHKAAIREAACGKIQGSEGGLVRDFMIEFYNWLREFHPAAKMILQVHDEVGVECPEAEADDVRLGMKQIAMEIGRKWLAPMYLRMDPKVVMNWADAK